MSMAFLGFAPDELLRVDLSLEKRRPRQRLKLLQEGKDRHPLGAQAKGTLARHRRRLFLKSQ